MGGKKRVVVVTDGDETAYRALSEACQDLDCHPLQASKGNPTPLSGEELIDAILKAPRDPVVVMVDDQGDADAGHGETALKALMDAPQLEVLGVVAVAANTRPVQGVKVEESVDRSAHLVSRAVNKAGKATSSPILGGDTVDALHSYSGVVIGLGDPGKMGGHDAIHEGVPATKRVLQEILRKADHIHARH